MGARQKSRIGKTLEKLFEFLYAQPSVTRDTAHGVGVDGIMSGYRDDSIVFGHDQMLALPNNLETSFFKGANCLKMRDAWYFGHD